MPERTVIISSIDPWVFEFYINRYTLKRHKIEDLKLENLPAGAMMMAQKVEMERLDEQHIPYRVVKTFENFSITRLSIDFLNPATRPQVLGVTYVIELLPQELPPAPLVQNSLGKLR